MTTESCKLLREQDLDPDDQNLQKRINSIMLQLGFNIPNGQTFHAFFGKQFLDTDGYLDLGMPTTWPAALVTYSNEEILEQSGSKSELRGWNEDAIKDFNQGFIKYIIPNLIG